MYSPPHVKVVVYNECGSHEVALSKPLKYLVFLRYAKCYNINVTGYTGLHFVFTRLSCYARLHPVYYIYLQMDI